MVQVDSEPRDEGTIAIEGFVMLLSKASVNICGWA
jgi:hypothetical protein